MRTPTHPISDPLAAAQRSRLALGLAFTLALCASPGCGSEDAAAPGRGGAASGTLEGEEAERYRRATALVRAGDDAAALPLLEEFVAAHPEHGEAIFLLGFVHYRNSLVELGATSVDHDRLRSAEECFRRSWELAPSSEVAYHVGLALERAKALHEAEPWFRRALDLDPANHGARTKLGVAALYLGRLEEARGHFEEVLARRPNDPDAWHQLGLVASESGDWSAACASLRRAVELAPDEAARHFDLSTALRRAGNDAEADAALAEFERLQPGVRKGSPANPAFARGRDAAQRGEWESAQAAFGEALALDPVHFPSLLGAGGVALRLGRAAEAADYLERAVERRTDDAFAHSQWARALSIEKRWSEAARALGRAVELAPDEARYRADLGGVLLTLDDLEPARVQLDRALALAPNDLRTRMNRGLLHERAGDPEAAARDFRAVLAAQADFPGARAALARVGGEARR